MIAINPYLNFLGESEEAFRFYKSAFGGNFAMLQRFKETPHKDQFPADEQKKIMHIALPVGKNMLMASDWPKSMAKKFKAGNNFNISVSAESRAEADRLFKKLSSKGKVEMPMQEQFWGDYFGMLTDRFKVQWMVSYRKPK
jgi:PhnB protein